MRYNVYLSENGLPTASEASEQFLALDTARLITSQLPDQSSRFLWVTGVDASGESQLSEVVRVKSLENQDNQDPDVQNESYQLSEDTELEDNVLSNDSDPEQSRLSANVLSPPLHGSLTLNSDGSFRYQPNRDYSGTDSFSYQVSDEAEGVASGTATLNVLAENDPPQVQDEQYSVDEELLLVVLAPGLLGNDLDVDGDSLSVELLEGPEFGQLQLTRSGGFEYQGNAEFNGEDRFSYRVLDGQGGEGQGVVVLTVNPVNDPPQAFNDSYQMRTNSLLSVDAANGLLANDSDTEGDNLSVNRIITPVSNGQLTLAEDGSFSYEPDTDFSGLDSFTYVIADGQGGEAQASAQILVTQENQAPSVEPDRYEVEEDGRLEVSSPGVLINDSDEDRDTLRVTGVTLQADGSTTAGGVLTMEQAGGFTFVAEPNAYGTLNYVYTVADSQGLVSEGELSLTILAVNDAPSASNDSYSVDEDTSLNVQAPGLLNNDSDVDTGDSLTVNTTPTLNPSKGSVSLNSDGSFSYTPNLNASGTDSFSYQISDGNGGLASADVVLTLNEVNDAPSASNDSYSVDEDTSLNVQAPGLLNNDNDVDSGDSLTVNTTPIASPSKGSVSLNSDGSFSYTPNLNASGTDSFSYQISDGNGGLASADVVLTLNGVNDAPSASNDSYSVDEDTSLNVQAPGLLNNDSDVDSGDSLTVNTTPIASPSKGSVSLNSDGSFSYTPNQNFNGSDSFTYEITDGNSGNGNNGNGVGGGNSSGLTAQATVTITVNAINDAPVAVTDAFSLNEGDTLSVEASGLLNNDSDVDTGDSLTVNTTPTLNPSKGNVSLNSDGSFSYTPNLNARGEDRFNYQVVDGAGGTATAEVVLTINAVNGAPVATADTYNVTEDTALTVNAPGLLSNDTDPDSGDTLSVLTTPVSGPTSGTLTLNSDGSFTYNPDSNFNGSDNFTYTVTDDAGGDTGNELSSQTTVTLTISAENDAPVVTASSVSVAENSNAGNVIGTVNASDVDSSITGYAITSGDPNGFFEIDSSGQVSLYVEATLNYEQAVQHVLTVQATDAEGATGSGSFTVNVTDVEEVQNVNLDSSFQQIIEIQGQNKQHQMLDVFQGSSKNIFATFKTSTNGLGVAKYTVSGQSILDFGDTATIGESGVSWYFNPSTAVAASSSQNTDDTVFIAGTLTGVTPNQATFYKFATDGNLDTSLGANGIIAHGESSTLKAQHIGFKSDGSIYVGGAVFNNSDSKNYFSLLEFNAAGTHQQTLSFRYPTTGSVKAAEVKRVLVDGSDNVYLVGENTDDGEWLAVKLKSDLTIDQGWGSGAAGFEGFVSSNTGANINLNSALLLNDELYLVGQSANAGFIGKIDAGGDWDSGFSFNDAGNPASFQLSGEDTVLTDIEFDGNYFYASGYSPLTDANSILLKISGAGSISASHSITLPNQYSYARGIVELAGGNLVLSAEIHDSGNSNVVDIGTIKVSKSGTIQSNYGNSGVTRNTSGFTDDYSAKTIKLASGKYLSAGYVSWNDGGQKFQGLLMRYNENGSLDKTFAKNGYALFDYLSQELTQFYDVVEVANGEYVAVGLSGANGIAVKFDSSGSIDTNWAASGVFLPTLGGNGGQLYNVIHLGSGQLAVAGGLRPSSGADIQVYVAKLTSTGTLDGAFATSGEYLAQINSSAVGDEWIYGGLLASDNNLVFAGVSASSGAGQDSLIFKLKADGSGLEPSFNSAGTPGLNLISYHSSSDFFYDVVTSSSGTLYAVGSILNGSADETTVTAIKSDGTLDSTFSTDGMASYLFGMDKSLGYGIRLDSNEKIVISGMSENSSAENAYIARILTDGSLDPRLNSGGSYHFNLAHPTAATSLILISDTEWVLGGHVDHSTINESDILIMKLNLAEN